MSKDDEIRLIAYGLWEAAGCPNGSDCEHWFKAEAIWEERNRTSNATAVPTKAQVKKASPKNAKSSVGKKPRPPAK